MNRRAASKAETRQLILNAARKMFLQKGVKRCTMREIAKAAGVSAASVVVHFHNKATLMEVALFEDVERTVARAIATLPAGGDLHARVVHIWRAMYVFYGSNRDLYRVLVLSAMVEKASDRPYLTRQLEEFVQLLSDFVEREKVAGGVRGDVHAQTATACLCSLYFGVLVLFLRDPAITPDMATEMVSAMTREHLTGILTEGKKSDRLSQSV